MASQAAGTLDSRIFNALFPQVWDGDRADFVVQAMTLPYLAKAIGATVAALRAPLARLIAASRVTTRTVPRSGEVLYKLTDKHHASWSAVSGSALRSLSL